MAVAAGVRMPQRRTAAVEVVAIPEAANITSR
jgi:hypothetical protein